MFSNIDAVAVVFHDDGAICGIDVYIDVGHKLGAIWIGGLALNHADHVVATIDDAFVEELVEPGNILDGFAENHCVLVYPQVFVNIFNRPDIGIGIIEDVLFIGFLLVLFCEIHINGG